ncbi:MAG: response regulator transcription factor [Candidatus Eremiobacteraeota bacterium]|nr:response regulator transcription factor [Candidatus Eremiobacteraeota bacterium]
MRVALDAGSSSLERLARTLGDGVELVPRDAAELIVRDAPAAGDVFAAIAEGFAVPTVVLVDDPHGDAALAALRAGAAAVLARQSDAHELLAALAAARAGLVVIDPAVRDALGPAAVAVRVAAPVEPLTERERQVLAMLADGRSNRRIAERLAISENTVKAHVAAIFAKLGATTRTEAVTLGVRSGLLML